MSTADLERSKRQFASLKRKFNRRQTLWEASEDAQARKQAAIGEMEALLEKVLALGQEGLALQREILDFLGKHRETEEDQEKEKDSGQSLEAWIRDRGNEIEPAPQVPADER